MKATQIVSYGAPNVLQVSEVDRPEPGPGEVLVAVGASSVNGHDALVRAGAMKIVSGRRFPLGVGLDFAGVVAAAWSSRASPPWSRSATLPTSPREKASWSAARPAEWARLRSN